jgi:dephospho-CoA kinase
VIVGLTGGICSGKSTAAAILRDYGVTLLDCDDLARYLTDFEPAVRESIRANWPEAFHPAGALDRGRLARIVFSDGSARARLEQILHPLILESVNRNIDAERRGGRPLVVVVPLLFELGMAPLFDQVWLVACQPETQVERLMQRNGLNAAEARQWIAAQWPLEHKLPLASLILRNDAKIADLQAAVESAWEGVLRDAQG